ncbi:hypothetical protein FB45DRAFT_501546 [Roridomyces roridus]|uniref:Uncharacterized protein n=1 Tax=Roridomyces roridus TaxID=1738132 RepID=A0AAD7BXC9_9AGAR|nr:hypothetical protein FB45DRAFT_501546 [Roridomyces roridus]
MAIFSPLGTTLAVEEAKGAIADELAKLVQVISLVAASSLGTFFHTPTSRPYTLLSQREWYSPGPLNDIVNWDDKDPENPLSFPNSKKWIITSQLAFCTWTVSFSSSVYSAGLESMARELRISESVAILGLSLYVLGFALGPLASLFTCYIAVDSPWYQMFAPLGEMYGRVGGCLDLFISKPHRRQLAILAPQGFLYLVFCKYAPVLLRRRASKPTRQSNGILHFVSIHDQFSASRTMFSDFARPFVFLVTEPIVLCTGFYIALASFFGTGISAILQSLTSYLIDAYDVYFASAVASTIVLRSVCAATMPLTVPIMFSHLGDMGAMVVLGALRKAMRPTSLDLNPRAFLPFPSLRYASYAPLHAPPSSPTGSSFCHHGHPLAPQSYRLIRAHSWSYSARSVYAFSRTLFVPPTVVFFSRGLGAAFSLAGSARLGVQLLVRCRSAAPVSSRARHGPPA